MTDGIPGWMGNLHGLLPHQFCWVLLTVLSVLCGAVIGVERGKRQKPAGLRTMMLICLGASIFTQASLLIACERADPGRIAAQIVTGVGFLGAGSIIHGRGSITGFTTAAAIWVVAAIGVILGSGFAAAGLLFTLLTVATLLAERSIESLLCGRCLWHHTTIELEDCNGRTRWNVQEILDEHMAPDELVRMGRAGDHVTLDVRYCARHRQHRQFVSHLVGLAATQKVLDDEVLHARSGIAETTNESC